ncbi:MAG: GatB/YqeY domain-containing protein [Legionellaceae bacterium]|nr:GatB/YqeY domain-containing protein [Legionellaceae bacterium]MBP9775522.1 GatB/YqeY domain-containing protein [Legionellaceae bacterium]
MTIKERINAEIKDAMRAQDKQQLGTLRLITAAIKQIEVDERIEVDDTRLLVILDKMVKQRKESIHQYQAASRDDLVAIENYELDIIRRYMPTPLSEDEVKALVAEAIQATQAEKMADMGKVMAHLKPQLQGRADMSTVSVWIKERLA